MRIAILILLVLASSVLADAKDDWIAARADSQEAQAEYHAARADFVRDRSSENEQVVIDTGKASLNAALDEAEAWLVWRMVDVEDNPDLPKELKDTITDDVNTNLDKIQALRTEVDGVTTQLDLGVVFLRMVGKYFELVADVAKNTGFVWVHIANSYADTIEEYIEELDGKLSDEKLDMARQELQNARDNIDRAEAAYEEVKLPGTPLIKFAEGNGYLRAAKANLLAAIRNLNVRGVE